MNLSDADMEQFVKTDRGKELLQNIDLLENRADSNDVVKSEATQASSKNTKMANSYV